MKTIGIGQEQINNCAACNLYKLLTYREAWHTRLWLCSSCFWHLCRLKEPVDKRKLDEWMVFRFNKVNKIKGAQHG